ncbi:MAG: DUF6058 family natural product biosynthesis protein [Telluria sp.]
MKLIRYLEHYFLTREQLLAQCAIDAAQLEQLQVGRLTPQPSYRLRLDLGCQSFFGQHEEQLAVDYYPKGYAAWLALAATFSSEEEARGLFFERYRARLAQLRAEGFVPRDPAFGSEDHLHAEWRGFLDGTYGLCTVSGLPEEIAAKEAAIALIRELTGAGTLDDAARALLRRSVDLLDSAGAPFAPHEVARSSRRRYVDEVRAAYGLTPPASAFPGTGQPCLQSQCQAAPAS